jgi:hypothetical protein
MGTIVCWIQQIPALSLPPIMILNNQEHYEARPQSKFPTRPTASKPYIARSDCAYVIEQ